MKYYHKLVPNLQILNRIPALNEAYQDHYYGHDQQDVNEPPYGVDTDNSQEPQDDKYDGNGYEHGIF
jgi:hypothetical protein